MTRHSPRTGKQKSAKKDSGGVCKTLCVLGPLPQPAVAAGRALWMQQITCVFVRAAFFFSELLTWVNPWREKVFDATWMEQDPFTSPDHNTIRGGGLIQHHVLAIFRSCASIAVIPLRLRQHGSQLLRPSIALLLSRCSTGFPDQSLRLETRSPSPLLRCERVSSCLSRNSKQSNPGNWSN